MMLSQLFHSSGVSSVFPNNGVSSTPVVDVMDESVKLTVFLADDNSAYRNALRSLLEMRRNVAIVGEATNGRDAVAQVIAHNPDVVLMDIVMPELDGIEATRQICQHCPKVCVIVVSMHASKEYIDNSFQAGARGYILKETAGTELTDALLAVFNGQHYLSGHIADKWIGD